MTGESGSENECIKWKNLKRELIVLALSNGTNARTFAQTMERKPRHRRQCRHPCPCEKEVGSACTTCIRQFLQIGRKLDRLQALAYKRERGRYGARENCRVVPGAAKLHCTPYNCDGVLPKIRITIVWAPRRGGRGVEC